MNNIEIIKDLIISILIVVVIVLGLSIFFYKDISFSKIIPESEEYMIPEEMKQDMEDTIIEEAEQIVTKYYIDSSDLKKYEKNKEYNKGKKNPFAEESDGTQENSSSNNTSNNNETENFYEDDGTK